jgi:hypothetical protein
MRSAHGPKQRSTMASTYLRCSDGATALRRIFHASFSCSATPRPKSRVVASLPGVRLVIEEEQEQEEEEEEEETG